MKLFVVLAALFLAINALSDQSAWTQFKAKHSRNYRLVEEKLRFQTFQNTLRKIEEHNARYENGDVSWFMNVTKFADWTDAEFLNMLNRQAASKPTIKEYLGTFVVDPEVHVPKSYDWRDSNSVLRVKDQGDCGSCWAFSVTGALEGQLVIHKNVRTELSEQQLIDCSLENFGCNGGDQVLTLEHVAKHGIVSEANYPYNGEDNSCKKVGTNVISSLSGVKRVDQDEDALAAAIATIGPIAVSADATYWSSYGGGIFDSYCGSNLNHAILGVGYGSEGKDYWIIKNSWGSDWGENGYIKVLRGKNLCGIKEDNSYPVL